MLSITTAKLSKSSSVPFIHKFATKQKKYVYDVNSSKILQVDDVIWNIINDFGKLPELGIINKYRKYHQEAKISKAYNLIAKTQQFEGLLLPNYPKIKFKITEKEIATALKYKRLQLILNVTNECNFRCLYCRYTIKANASNNHSNRKMSWRIAKAAIDDFLPFTQKTLVSYGLPPAIAFYGGEPLLNFPLIKKCVKYIREATGGKTTRLILTTNGSLLTSEVADFLTSSGFLITVSLDGPEYIHNLNRKRKDGTGTWELVFNNIETLLKKYSKRKNDWALNINAVLPPQAKALEFEKFFSTCNLFTPNVYIKAILMKPSRLLNSFEHDIPKDLDELQNKYFQNLIKGERDSKEYSIERSLFEETYRNIHKRTYPNSVKPFFDNPLMFSTSMCVAGLRRYYVSVEGNYYPCERIPEHERFKIGDIYQGIDANKVYKLVERFFNCNKKQCENCWCIRMCQVGCYANITGENKLTSVFKQNACTKHRKDKHEAIVNYCSILEQNPNAFDYMKNIERC